MLLSPFEDEYTRQSRLKGEKDGAAARAAASGSRYGRPRRSPSVRALTRPTALATTISM
jgi:hypothetical protein